MKIHCLVFVAVHTIPYLGGTKLFNNKFKSALRGGNMGEE